MQDNLKITGVIVFFQIYSLAIFQIMNIFPENLNHVCISPDQTIPAKSPIDVFILGLFAFDRMGRKEKKEKF